MKWSTLCTVCLSSGIASSAHKDIPAVESVSTKPSAPKRRPRQTATEVVETPPAVEEASEAVWENSCDPVEENPTESTGDTMDCEPLDDENQNQPLYGLAANQAIITMSYTLLSQVRQVAQAEGISAEDFIVELVAEGITRRAFEDASRPAPSHLMTRTGYVPPEADNYQAPRLSHHNSGNSNGQGGNSYRSNGNGGGQHRFNRNKPGQQNQNRFGGRQGQSQGGQGNSNRGSGRFERGRRDSKY